ncbi:784_t:CDS:2, partial [Cetraspora pellucida]
QTLQKQVSLLVLNSSLSSTLIDTSLNDVSSVIISSVKSSYKLKNLFNDEKKCLKVNKTSEASLFFDIYKEKKPLAVFNKNFPRSPFIERFLDIHLIDHKTFLC